MKNPMASVHDENKAKIWRSSDDFGLRSPVIQKPLQTKATVGGVPQFSLACLSQLHEWLCTPRMKIVLALVSANLRSPLHCGFMSSM